MMQKLDVTGFDTLSDKARRALAAQSRKLLVCAGTGCVADGALKIHARLQELLAARGLETALWPARTS